MYHGIYSNMNGTSVNLSGQNFKYLGSFSGTASEPKMRVNIIGEEGIVSEAKTDLINKAKKAGIELKDSRVLCNVIIEATENKNTLSVTVSADVIEYTK